METNSKNEDVICAECYRKYVFQSHYSYSVSNRMELLFAKMQQMLEQDHLAGRSHENSYRFIFR